MQVEIEQMLSEGERIALVYVAMISDNIDALHITRLGHMDHKIRMAVADGVIQPDPQRDIRAVACVERYEKSGRAGKGFVSGFGLKAGALASSVGHDHHNITVVGASAADMAVAVNRIVEIGRGLVVVWLQANPLR